MLFNSLPFLAFFAIVWTAYWLLRGRRRPQNAVLLAASCFFYGWWDWRFLGLIVFSTVVDYLCGLAFDRPALTARRRRGLLGISLVANLGVLAFFKYFDFFAESLREACASVGVTVPDFALHWVLPVGISFYTFQTLSYSIDRYRGKLATERSLLDFALFVSFFPQLVAGPIVRAKDFLPQLKRERDFRWSDQALGLQLSLWGLFKKVVVADNLSPFVDSVFGADEPAGVLVRIAAVYAFAIQIYCDFSGYTDIARGTARMLGFDLPLNFRRPYFALDPSDFWRRWHISLSTWLRDYLYISLGGNRGGSRRTTFNLMATMVLGGLWHGAAWNFVLWGFYQGLLLVVHRVWRERRPAPAHVTPLRRAIAWFGFLQLVCFGWLLFRARSFGEIVAFLSPGGGWIGGLVLSDSIARGLVLGGVGAVVLFAWDAVQARRGDVELPIERARPLTQALVCVALYLAVSLAGSFLGDEFIYFQF